MVIVEVTMVNVIGMVYFLIVIFKIFCFLYCVIIYFYFLIFSILFFVFMGCDLFFNINLSYENKEYFIFRRRYI